MRAGHDPVSHHFHFLLQRRDHHLADLVYFKADRIMLEFSSLLSCPLWAQPLMDASSLSLDQKHSLIELGIEVTCNHAAGYDRRVREPTKQYPLKLMWLCFKPADEVCPHRQAIAREIHETPMDQLDTNCAKLRRKLTDDLKHAADTGQAKPTLYSFGLAFKSNVKESIWINESHNSIIRGCCTKNRNIGLPLVSARCNSKKELGMEVGLRGSSSKWSKIRPVANQLLEDSIRHVLDGEDVLKDRERWSVPEPAGDLEKDAVRVATLGYIKSHMSVSAVSARDLAWGHAVRR